jgi:hypothetical protein
MAQHDYNIANQSGAAFRQDLNNALAAIVSQNSGAVEPSTTYAYQFWADTTAGLLKIRNAANSAWITLRELDGTLAIEAGTVSAPGVAFTGDLNTGFYSPGADQAAISTGGVQAVAWDANGNQTNRAGITATSLNGGQLAGTRNRIINGGLDVDQRFNGAAVTFTAGAALGYIVDRWYGYCTGANVTGQKIPGAILTPGTLSYSSAYRITGASSCTSIGFGQRIEALNCYDLAGTTATLSVSLANSLLTTVTWTAYYASTNDSFGTLASPTRTQIASGTFTVNSTVTRYSANMSIPAAASTGIEIVFTVGAQTSGTWTISNVQLEPGTVATPFERRSHGQELALCQRYYEKSYSDSSVPGTVDSVGQLSNVTFGNSSGIHGSLIQFMTPKRAAPSITIYSPNTGVASRVHVYAGSFTGDATASAARINATRAGVDSSVYSTNATSACVFHYVASIEL